MTMTEEALEAQRQAHGGTTWPLHGAPLGDLAAMSDDELVACLSATHDAIRVLRDQENALATEAGKRLGKVTGNLADGRQFTLSRSADRKEWDHDDWKRDARRVIAASLSERFVIHSHDDAALVDTQTGEEVPLGRIIQEAMAQVQEVHGSTAPRTTALKRLGLYASDYCTSKPSGWRFDALAPTTTTED